MPSQYIVSGYTITEDPNFQNEKFGNSQALIDQFNELYIESQNKKNKKIIKKLTDLSLKYPRSPQLKNFLSVAYAVQGNYRKATEVNKWILSEHPDYLFAKLNLANEFIEDKHPEKVPEVLGEAMEIKELYPDRDLFHLAEVTGFFKTAIRYYTAIENLELAENRLEVLKGIAPDHPDTYSAEMFLFALRMERGSERFKKEKERQIKVECARAVPVSDQMKAPEFHHPGINNLYKYGLDIPTEYLQEILELDRDTVIGDLEKVLQDAVDRYQFFINPEIGNENLMFPLHAICLLAELKAENSLPVILDFLGNDEEVLDFWLDDHLNETIWQPLYWFSQNSLGLLKQFLLKPGIYTFAKTSISQVLFKIASHQPERKGEIEAIYKDVLTYYVQADLNENIIDTLFIGLVIGDIIDCGFIGLLPEIKQLHDLGYVDISVNGIYEDVVKHFNDPFQKNDKSKIKNIFELYENILKTWASYKDDDDFSDDKVFGYDDDALSPYLGSWDERIVQPAVSSKIGRNDPCPCGSGKKYKKCCMNDLPL